MTTKSHHCPRCSKALSIAKIITEFCEECLVDVKPTLNPPAHDRPQVDRAVPRDGAQTAEAA
jgi:hypothetical protein